jgi:hypothetical protein
MGFTQRERALGHQKGAITTVGTGTPGTREGSDGDLTLRKVAKGLILYIKKDNRWYDVNNLNISAGSSVMTIKSTSATPVDNVNVAGIVTIFVDTDDYDYVIGGFVGGVLGQKLYIAKVHADNVLTLEHDAASNIQEIFTPDAANLDFPATEYGGVTLICNGSDWYCVGIAHPNSNDS